MSSYCTFAPGHPVHGAYHDREYGFPIVDDNQLFERLMLEINQAGLSWETILKKRETLRRAYRDFNIAKVANFGARDKKRLLADPGVIRNRLKIDAAISNAQRLLGLVAEFGSVSAWLDRHHPLPKAHWVKLFRREFKFTGGEIVNEFLLSTGYLPGAHTATCPVYKKVVASQPPWTRA